MAHTVAWLPDAVADLETIARYIAVDSPAYAAVVVERITLAARTLAEFPEIGRIVPEWNDESIRERIVYSYRLIYRHRAEDVLVLAVIHGARLLPDESREQPD